MEEFKKIVLKNRDMAIALSLLWIYAAVLVAPRAGLDPVELAGVAANITAVTLMRRQNVWGYIVAIFANSLLAAYFFGAGLSGQGIVRALYALMSGAGAYAWGRPAEDGAPKKPTYLPRVWQIPIAAGLAAVVAAQIAMGRTAVGVIDYASLYLSLSGALLIMDKKVEGWILWTLVDFVNIPLFVMSGAYLNIFYHLFSIANEMAAIPEWHREARIRARR
jgi:nicotinamide mononucleotide transporter PnuC